MKRIFTIAILLFSVLAQAQVKIGDNPTTINANSLLELESTDKGFLPPRVTLVSLDNVSPLTGTVIAGTFVYNNGGAVPAGYYFWDGAKWGSLTQSNMVTKTANATLTKGETFVLASNDIKLTLPVVTAAENGLAVTVKHIGIHTDEVVVVPSGAAKIDGIDSSTLYRWLSRTFVAYNGNWIYKGKESRANNVFDVSSTGSWTTITEALEFLNVHMNGPSVIRLSGETFEVPITEVIDLQYPVTIQGTSYGMSTLVPATGLGSNPMFRCLTETYFKHLAFDATALAGYGLSAGQDAIQLEGAGEYFEIKDCSFERFNKTIVAEDSIELWLFETDITDAVYSGLEIAAGTTVGVKVTSSECDYNNCARGINMASGISATINIVNCTFYNGAISNVGINYVPASFTTFNAMFITNNAWNNIGLFFSGFDFTLVSGRDAKAFIQNNAGDGDKNPNCHINVLNSATTTTLPVAGTWYKADWNSAVTTFTTTKWEVSNGATVNRITYQPTNKRSGYFVISGNLSVNGSSRTISLGIVKNGVSTTRFGETTIRTGTSNTPTLFSTVVYISDIAATNTFEIYCSTLNGGDIVKFQDVQWLAETK